MEIRDPVHGFITVSPKVERLLDLPFVQRLRRIKQTAMANLLYPGANHTRFEHSLGCMHVAGRLARALKLDQKDVHLIEQAALLHDVGHGPFSHVSEHLLVQYAPADARDHLEEIHEEITRLAIDGDADLQRLLGDDKDKVRDLLLKRGVRDVRHDIISGPFVADKLDYLLRDSHYAGVKYGTFDLERIVRTVALISAGIESYMGIDEGGFWAVEQLLLAKHHMNVQVYRHKVRLITDAMLVRAIEIGIREGDENLSQVYHFRADKTFVDNYLTWDDERLMRTLLASGLPKVQNYAERLFERRLFKSIYSQDTKDFKDALTRNRISRLAKPDLADVEKTLSEVLNRNLDLSIDSDSVIVDIQSLSNPTFRPPGVKVFEGDILVQMKDGTRKLAIDYPNTILGKTREPEQEVVSIYVPLDGIQDADRKALITRAKDHISRTLENV